MLDKIQNADDSAGEDGSRRAPQCGGNAHGAAALEDSLAVSYNTKQTLRMRSSNHDPQH